ncbi:MAG: hypothetical protein IMF07_08640 [Proteobacteria bacterium]|nr:hypothetical protein [Pseudomonadota bacterium]
MIEDISLNLKLLESVIDKLGSLAEEMVFLGGCSTEILITDRAASPIRNTIDVDVIVDLTSMPAYYELSDKLRTLGFSEDMAEGAPLCRWKSGEMLLDVMPVSSKLLGFGNIWYEEALENALLIELPSGRKIRLITAPYFLGTKLEAFKGRGEGDYFASHDLEDIIALIDGRSELVNEVSRSRESLRVYLEDEFSALLKDPRFIESVSGHLPPDDVSQARLPLIIERVRKIAGQS